MPKAAELIGLAAEKTKRIQAKLRRAWSLNRRFRAEDAPARALTPARGRIRRGRTSRRRTLQRAEFVAGEAGGVACGQL